jgi:hypothetical protein
MASAMFWRFCAGLRERSTAPLALGPTAIFSMQVSGVGRNPPFSAMATTAMALARPWATMVVPSRGSRATSSADPSPLPICSPTKSIGASSRSPSPITTVPEKGTASKARRMASTAA